MDNYRHPFGPVQFSIDAGTWWYIYHYHLQLQKWESASPVVVVVVIAAVSPPPPMAVCKYLSFRFTWPSLWLCSVRYVGGCQVVHAAAPTDWLTRCWMDRDQSGKTTKCPLGSQMGVVVWLTAVPINGCCGKTSPVYFMFDNLTHHSKQGSFKLDELRIL